MLNFFTIFVKLTHKPKKNEKTFTFNVMCIWSGVQR